MTAYYNEHDSYAAQWLRNLIAAGEIADGVVDERSIVDVRPEDLEGFTQCHFFAGIAGWSLALRRAGVSDDRPVWTASLPCQPFSAAGQGRGVHDERHLWPVFYDLVRACRPGLILGEQVASAAVIGPASKAGKRREASDGWPWFSIVQSDLEDARYACGAVPFPAAGVGAPHNRMRLYWCARGLADSPSARFDGALGGAEREARNEARLRLSGAVGGFDRMADSQSERRLGWPDDGDGGRGQCASGPGSEIGGVGRSDEWIATEHVLLRQRSSDSTETSGACASLVLADDDDEGLERRRGMPERPAQFVAGARGVAGGVADTDGGNGGAEGLQRSGEQRFEPKDSFVGVMDDGRRSGPINGVWRDADWIFCTDGKWRPVEPGTQPLASGVPGRVGRLRAYGNAICVEQAKIFIESVFESLDSL